MAKDRSAVGETLILKLMGKQKKTRCFRNVDLNTVENEYKSSLLSYH